MRGRKEPPTTAVEECVDADDALTTDPDLRIRQLSLVLYSARVAAEKASSTYASAIKRLRAAEINMARAVHEKRAARTNDSSRELSLAPRT